jgi:hypothetical protein
MSTNNHGARWNRWCLLYKFLQEYIGSWKKGVGIGDMQSYATLETNGCC